MVASLMLLSTLSANNQTFNVEGKVQPGTAAPIPTHASLPPGPGRARGAVPHRFGHDTIRLLNLSQSVDHVSDVRAQQTSDRERVYAQNARTESERGYAAIPSCG